MSLTPEDRSELRELIKVTINDGCLCKYQTELTHLIDRLEALGNGNVRHGIESFSRTLEWMTKIRRFGEKAGGKIALMLALSVGGGIGALIVSGFKALLGKTSP
jgi:hypothetical protein